jgi:DNA polymerase-3 subunit gamma/tau
VARACGEHLANVMRLQVRVVELGSGRLVFAQPPEFREDQSADLRAALQEATGERWAIARVDTGGAPTLVEQQLAIAEAAEAELRADPLVAAALSAFPEAEIIDRAAARRASGGMDYK